MNYTENSTGERSTQLGIAPSKAKELTSGEQLLIRMESLASRASELSDRLGKQLSPVMQPAEPRPETPGLARNKPPFFVNAESLLDALEATLENLQSISHRLEV